MFINTFSVSLSPSFRMPVTGSSCPASLIINVLHMAHFVSNEYKNMGVDARTTYFAPKWNFCCVVDYFQTADRTTPSFCAIVVACDSMTFCFLLQSTLGSFDSDSSHKKNCTKGYGTCFFSTCTNSGRVIASSHSSVTGPEVVAAHTWPTRPRARRFDLDPRMTDFPHGRVPHADGAARTCGRVDRVSRSRPPNSFWRVACMDPPP